MGILPPVVSVVLPLILHAVFVCCLPILHPSHAVWGRRQEAGPYDIRSECIRPVCKPLQCSAITGTRLSAAVIANNTMRICANRGSNVIRGKVYRQCNAWYHTITVIERLH